MNTNPVTRAIQIVGLYSLAKTCNVSYQAVLKWERKRIPAERVLAVERATGGRISRYELRPDIYPVNEHIA